MSEDFRKRFADLSAKYRDHFHQHPAGLLVRDFISLYGDGIEERNTTFEVEQWIPDFIAIGDDSGGTQFYLRRDGSEAVYMAGVGAISVREPEVIHSSFAGWVAQGCPLPDDESDDAPGL